ncbi:hypothetical protein H5410_015673 [Solanum commersonii]|uniref:Uncharacterized protein n=1 Tax=Solanum commersonii TaxID=4109 RepID=A0A9J5ZUE0_SOLCO|nr:hypothetical protein H5410_015673 [Solanum commersonii]
MGRGKNFKFTGYKMKMGIGWESVETITDEESVETITDEESVETITDEAIKHNCNLCSYPGKEEVKQAVFALSGESASGPDGFTIH